MVFNWEATETNWFVDQNHNMMMDRNPNWDPNGDHGAGDAIGRTFMAYYTYGDERFLEGIENCWEKVERKGWLKKLLFGKYYYQGYRFPDKDPNRTGLSRDHLTYSILAFKYAGYSEEFLKDFVKHLRWKISDVAKFTPDLWLWTRVISNLRGFKWIYYPIQWITLKLSSTWNRKLIRYIGIGPERHQEDFIPIPNDFKPKRIRKLIKKLYPIYALHIQSWQIKLLPDSNWKKRLEKAALGLCPEHNYAIQLLLRDPFRPSKEDVENYKSMRGGRWTGILNPWINDRDIHIETNKERLEYNIMDVDYLHRLYNSVSCTPY
jgi:hypothetical protein